MCRAVTCHRCGKTTWAGCGRHVDEVLRGVPEDERCPGHHADPARFWRRLVARRFGS